MKQIFSYFICVLSLASGTLAVHAQSTNIPNGVTAPAAPTVTPVTLPAAMTPPSGSLNFVRTFVPQIPVTSPTNPIFSLVPTPSFLDYVANVKTVYVNGWGNVLETINRGTRLIAGVSVKDVVTMNDLRPSMAQNSFLPYPATESSHFITTPFADQRTYYAGTHPEENNMTYGKTVSSLQPITISPPGAPPTTVSNIPISVSYNPGSSLVGNGRGVTTTSTIDDGSNHIKKYCVLNNTLSDQGEYASNFLTVKSTIGQHNENTREFFDLNGRLICKKQYAGTAGSTPDWLTTYYVYDDLGRLTYILTPKAVSSGDVFGTLSSLSFSYTYNQYGQPVSSSKPGKSGADLFVYDGQRRPVLMQSPLLRAVGKYMFKIYDSRGRVVISGIYSDATPASTLQGWLNTSSTTPTPGSLLYILIHGFSGTYPASIPSCEIDQINYYDQYPSFCTGFDASFSTYYQTGVNMVTPAVYNFTQGMLTASQTLVRDGSTTPTYVRNQFYYDQKGHTIQVKTLNPWNTTNWDVTTMQYDFAGHLVTKAYQYYDQSTSNKTSSLVQVNYNYNIHTGRLTNVTQKIDGDVWHTLAAYKYDDLGNISEKSLGGVEVQDYTYNIRGQLTSINKDYANNPCDASAATSTFGCVFSYDYGYSMPRYDGSISGFMWRGASNAVPMRSYGYQYDPAGRVTEADFTQYCTPGTSSYTCSVSAGTETWNKDMTDFTMDHVTYDDGGNILTMHQMGTPLGGTSPLDIDQLTYQYNTNSNQLKNVTDGVTTDYHIGDFVDRNTAATSGFDDYSYDADGNLAKDLNKKVANMTYNELDKPVTVQFTDGSSIVNVYDAGGRLVKKTTTDASSAVHVTRYWGPFVYQDDVLQYILHEEGRVRWVFDSLLFKYDYFVKDHLGNVRTVVTSDAIPSTTYFAGHEVALSTTEDAVFSNIEAVRAPKPGSTSTTDFSAAMLDASVPTRQIGTAILLKVMAGDQFDISAASYWDADSVTDSTINPMDLLGSVISSLTTGVTGGQSGEAQQQIINGTLSSTNFSTYEGLVSESADPEAPQAFINYMVFDENMNLIPSASGAIQVASVAGSWQIIGTPSPVTAPSTGYVAIFMSSATVGPVYLDPLAVTVYHGRLLQEQHYYPFGLAINVGEATGGSNVSNKFKFETNEVTDDFGLALQDFHARRYDYQIGRFTGVDIMADQGGQDMLNPYHFCSNNPANLVDPSGMLTGAQVGMPDRVICGNIVYIFDYYYVNDYELSNWRTMRLYTNPGHPDEEFLGDGEIDGGGGGGDGDAGMGFIQHEIASIEKPIIEKALAVIKHLIGSSADPNGTNDCGQPNITSTNGGIINNFKDFYNFMVCQAQNNKVEVAAAELSNGTYYIFAWDHNQSDESYFDIAKAVAGTPPYVYICALFHTHLNDTHLLDPDDAQIAFDLNMPTNLILPNGKWYQVDYSDDNGNRLPPLPYRPLNRHDILQAQDPNQYEVIYDTNNQ